VKTTAYFDAIHGRPDRSVIQDAWIEPAIRAPICQSRQTDGRIRQWVQAPEMENRYLRVILLRDGETVHENTALDIDAQGNICSITVEHASERAGAPHFSYEEVAA